MSKSDNRGEPSDLSQSQRLWKMLWRIRVPDTVKIHGWRVIHRAIPVFEELKKRGCPTSKECGFCGFRGETIEHIFLMCWWSKAFWRKVGMEEMPDDWQGDIVDWLGAIASKGNVETLTEALVGLWVIWQNRNMIIHGSRGWEVEGSVLRVKNYMHLFRHSSTLRSSLFDEPDIIYDDKLTVFCDGAWCKETKQGGYAAFVWKESCVYACKTGSIDSCSSPGEAELRGVIAGIEIVEKLNLQEVEFVSDSTEMVWGIGCGLGIAGHQSAALRAYGFNAFSRNAGWSIRHIFREKNWLADALAKLALRRRWEWNSVHAIPKELAQCRFLGPSSEQC